MAKRWDDKWSNFERGLRGPRIYLLSSQQPILIIFKFFLLGRRGSPRHLVFDMLWAEQQDRNVSNFLVFFWVGCAMSATMRRIYDPLFCCWVIGIDIQRVGWCQLVNEIVAPVCWNNRRTIVFKTFILCASMPSRVSYECFAFFPFPIYMYKYFYLSCDRPEVWDVGFSESLQTTCVFVLYSTIR